MAETATTLTVPTVHLNGTSRDELIEQYQTAHTALREAITAVCAAAPNGRDYYPQGPTAYEHARDEHEARLGKLYDVQHELENLYMRLAFPG